jgi:NAD(P)-dependent dehydrogenase (short-subunit alcohol dehydrogenase family)
MTSPERFSGIVMLVTGGASGIGRATAERAAREGATVAILDKNAAAAMSAAEELRRHGNGAIGLACDITDDGAAARAVDEAVAALGPIGVLINNAGGTTTQTFELMDAERWRREIDLNLNGAYFVTRAAVASMAERGGGAIVNVASVNGLTTIAEPAYSAAKAGLLQFTRHLAVEYGPRGIRANAVVPGSIRTPIWASRLEERPDMLDALRRWYPIGRVGEPEEVAAAILFLASAEAGFINGASLVVDGGLTAGLPLMTKDVLSAAAAGSR